MSRLLKILITLFVLFNLMFFAVLFYPVPKVFRQTEQQGTVKVADRNGEVLYEVLNEKGRQTFVALDVVPEHLKNAFLSVEDQRFYEHGGVDLRAILRAVWQNVSAGKVISGGSTITQQTVRNVVGMGEARTVFQKIKESLLAIKISRFLDKNEVFELYVNSIYFGGLAYGAEAASWQYFNKSVAHLDLAESAFLAGLPQAPNRYNPFKHFEDAKARQQVVLNAMVENQVITEAERDRAFAEQLELGGGDFSKKAPHFVDMVLRQLSLGVDSRLPAGEAGFRGNDNGNGIRTTLDLGLQEQVETILESDLTFLSKYNIHNGAAVILDVRTGEVLAMVGSSDYHDESIDGEVNVATSLRQPGSSIKPLLYAAALGKGWRPDTVILDEPVRFETADGLPYSPKNFDLQFRGEVTLAEALAQSLNVPAVKTLDFVGVGEFLGQLKRFGITTLNESAQHYGLSLALGSGEVKLLELTNAYSTFANGGKRAPVRFYWLAESGGGPTGGTARFLGSARDDSEAEGTVGKMIGEADGITDGIGEIVKVVEPEVAEMISAILSSNNLRMPAFGEENPLKFSFAVAAKTGTTRNFRDNWTIGYTDDYAVGVWVGNSSGAVMEGVSGISGAGPIFNKIMNMLHQNTGSVLTAGQGVQLAVGRKVEGALPANGGTRDENDFRIISPFVNDVFLFDPGQPAEFQKIRLEASEPAQWLVDGELIGEGESVLWQLKKGSHEIKAVFENYERVVEILVR